MKENQNAGIKTDVESRQIKWIGFERWANYWQQIVQPSAHLQNEAYRQARTLSILLIVLLVAASIILPIWLLTDPDFPAARLISMGIVVSLILAYALSRTPYHYLGAVTLIGLLPVTVVIIVLTAPGATTERMLALNFLTVAILLASIFLNVRATGVLAFGSLLIVSVFFFIPDVPFAVTYSYVVYLSVMTVLVMLSTVIRKRYSHQLQSSEAVYRQLFDHAPIGILSADADGNILTVNPAALNMLGSPTEKATRTINLLSFPLLVESGIAGDIHRCLQTDAIIISERLYTSKWGKTTDFRLHISPMQNADARVAGFQILLEDISERKRNETLLKRQNRLLETVHEISRAISTTLDTQHILSTVAKAVAQAIDASSVYICDWKQDQGTTTVLAEYFGPGASDLERQSDLKTTYDLAEVFGGLAGWLRNPRGYSTVDIDDPNIGPKEYAHLEQYGAYSTLVVPLRMPEKIIGYIEVWESRHKRQFSTEEIEIVKAIAQQTATAIENAQLYQQVKEQQEYNLALLDAIPEVIFHLNSDGIFLDYRAENTRDFITPKQFLNQHYRDVLPMKLSQHLAIAIDTAIQTSQIQSFEYELGSAEQDVQIYEARVATTQMGTSIVVSRNVTEQKQAEKNRFELTLQHEKTELLKQFISHLSHDLKTPLSVIRINLSLLQRIHDPYKQQTRLETIHQQTQRLERLIQDILTVSRLDHLPEFVFEPVDLNQLIRDIVQQLRSLAEDKHLTIVTSLETDLQPVRADKDELARAVINLVENAISYTNDGSIRIRTKDQADQVMFVISDTGIGIAEAKLPYIFDRFYRTDEARSSHSGGSGLGLAIVKKIVEGHGGSINVESVQGNGTTFHIKLPGILHR